MLFPSYQRLVAAAVTTATNNLFQITCLLGFDLVTRLPSFRLITAVYDKDVRAPAMEVATKNVNPLRVSISRQIVDKHFSINII